MTWNKHGSHINFTLALVQFILGFYWEGACTWHSTTNNHPKNYIPSHLYWSIHSEEYDMAHHQDNHNLYTTKYLWSHRSPNTYTWYPSGTLSSLHCTTKYLWSHRSPNTYTWYPSGTLSSLHCCRRYNARVMVF
jgi:hypothetical protein